MAYLDNYLKARNEALLRGKSRSRRQVIKGEHRKHVISAVVDTLRDWRLSPFEYEASCHQGLRASLCASGTRWTVADLEAATIVAEGLRIIGAKRPTWEQGQREYVEPRENCAWCRNALPEDLQLGGFHTRFCSEHCARAALAQRDFETRSSADRSYGAVYEAIRRLRTEPRECRECRKLFRPKVDSQVLCSTTCRAVSATVVPARACAQCGITFKPFVSQNSGRGRFCSVACKATFQTQQRIERKCEFCYQPFIAASSVAKFCSKACTMTSHRIKNGGLAKVLKPHVFDHYFGGELSRSAEVIDITPYLFDREFSRLSMCGGSQGAEYIRGTG